MQFEVNLMFTGPSEIFPGSVIRPEKVFPAMKSEGNVVMHEELHIPSVARNSDKFSGFCIASS